MGPIINIFVYSDYKKYLNDRIEWEGRHEKGYKSKLSQAMGTPSSFLSQVLHGPTHLSLDHAFALAEYWGLSGDEQEYFHVLVQKERAGGRAYRVHLERKLSSLKQRNESLSKRFSDEYIPPSEFQWKYYTSWHYAAIHLICAIPECHLPKKMAERLKLPLSVVQETLKDLEKHRLVEARGGGYFPTSQKVHLDKASSASPVNHLIWRQKVIETLLVQRRSGDLHYSGVHTLSAADYDKIKNLLIDALERARHQIHSSPEEKLVGLTLDYFEI